MKKALFAVAAVALLAVSVQAGEIKTHSWPCTFTPLDITTIPVVMDVGYWVSITNQSGLKITLSQMDLHWYQGCATMKMKTNTNLTVSATIEKSGAIPGNYSTWIEGTNTISMGSTDVVVCAKVENADLSAQPGGTTGVNVATVTIWVVPTS